MPCLQWPTKQVTVDIALPLIDNYSKCCIIMAYTAEDRETYNQTTPS